MQIARQLIPGPFGIVDQSIEERALTGFHHLWAEVSMALSVKPHHGSAAVFGVSLTGDGFD